MELSCPELETHNAFLNTVFPNLVLGESQTVCILGLWTDWLGGSKNMDSLWVPEDQIGEHWVYVIKILA